MRNELVNQKLIPVYGLIGILALIIVKVYNTAFKGGKFTCNKYILNTYLYILLALVIMSLQNITMERQNVPPTSIFGIFGGGWTGVILLFVLSLGLLMWLLSINPQNVLLKHMVWLVFILYLGLLAYPTYIQTIEENTVIVTLMTTIAILIGFSVLAFVKPEWISLSWGPLLCFVLLGGIIGELCFYFFSKDKKVTGRSKAFSYFFIILFTLFILYDTKKIQVNAKSCKESTVDYINESLGIVLDALNLFQNIADVQN
mgnify:CR=1 FL=1